MVKNKWLTDYLIKITLLTNFMFTVDIYLLSLEQMSV